MVLAAAVLVLIARAAMVTLGLVHRMLRLRVSAVALEPVGNAKVAVLVAMRFALGHCHVLALMGPRRQDMCALIVEVASEVGDVRNVGNRGKRHGCLIDVLVLCIARQGSSKGCQAQ